MSDLQMPVKLQNQEAHIKPLGALSYVLSELSRGEKDWREARAISDPADVLARRPQWMPHDAAAAFAKVMVEKDFSLNGNSDEFWLWQRVFNDIPVVQEVTLSNLWPWKIECYSLDLCWMNRGGTTIGELLLEPQRTYRNGMYRLYVGSEHGIMLGGECINQLADLIRVLDGHHRAWHLGLFRREGNAWD